MDLMQREFELKSDKYLSHEIKSWVLNLLINMEFLGESSNILLLNKHPHTSLNVSTPSLIGSTISFKRKSILCDSLSTLTMLYPINTMTGIFKNKKVEETHYHTSL